MGAKFHRRLADTFAALTPAKLRIDKISLVAIREAKVRYLFCIFSDTVKCVVWQVFRKPISRVIGIPKLTRFWMKVKAHGVAYAFGNHFKTTAIKI